MPVLAVASACNCCASPAGPSSGPSGGGGFLGARTAGAHGPSSGPSGGGGFLGAKTAGAHGTSSGPPSGASGATHGATPGEAQSTAGNQMQTALHQLNLPPEDQVRLVLDIVNAMPDPKKLPAFLSRRRSQCRPDTLADFSRPVESPAEHSLFMECHLLHTNPRSKRTDWRRVTREFNLRVTRSWQERREVSDLWLKPEVHLKQFEKQLVMQASLAEMNRTSTAIYGLQATAGLGQAPGQPPMLGQAQGQPAMLGQAPVQGQAPVLGQGPVHRQATGQGPHFNLQPPGAASAPLLSATAPGRGGKGRPKTCKACHDRGYPHQTKLGHDCGLFLFLKGWMRDRLVQQQVNVSQIPASRQEAEAIQNRKTVAALQDKKRKHPGQ
ncbi:hypothetical protein ABBQ32_008344 [Trebouxia sp. C0010 RCD-2024]